jgi:hypothetical protein
MVQQNIAKTKEDLLKQLIGEWDVGIAMKTSEDKIISGCGKMTAVDADNSSIKSEIDAQIEDQGDFYENNFWILEENTGKVHLYSVTSEGETHDHVGDWKDDTTLELNWKETFEYQGMEEQIKVKWLTKDQIELEEIKYSKGKVLLTTNFIFKRKQA